MRPLEILTLANTATYVTLATTFLRRSVRRRRAAFLTPAIAVAQALLEGPRWQLIAAYVLSVLFPAIGLLRCKSARFAGVPGISLPMTLNSEGLPLGLELGAAVGRDRDLLALARGVEQVIGRVPGPTGSKLQCMGSLTHI